MAGHSKWANIQHRKKAQDAKRGKIFTRLIREITVAARMGGGDINANARLRAAIDTAKSANMPNDTIDRAVKKGSGELGDTVLEEIRYEGYGPGGTAILVDCMTDNKNRTVSDVRHAFSKAGGNLGTDGSVAYLFNKVGQIIFAPGSSEDKVMDVALEADVDDVNIQKDGSIEVLTSPETLSKVIDDFKSNQLVYAMASVEMLPATSIEIEDNELAEKIERLLDHLDGLDDVQNIYTNANLQK